MQDMNLYNYTKFNSTLIAKAVRIYPMSWKSNPCFRVEFVGCRARGEEFADRKRIDSDCYRQPPYTEAIYFT